MAVHGLTSGYNGRPAIEALSFTVPRGSMVALIGPNGSGKSTLIKALLGLLPPWAGGVSVLGRSPEEARPLIGYMPQAEQVDWSFPITVREVVEMGRYRPNWRPSRLRGLLGRQDESVEIALERARVRPLAARQIGELSGGQQRRVLLARTLVRDPDLFLLDEPAAGLDVSVEEDMLDLFQELAAAGKTLIVATHDLPCVMRCYGLALCLNRRVVAYGRPAEVLTEATLTEAFGRHLVLYQMGGQQYAMEPHVEHPAHEPVSMDWLTDPWQFEFMRRAFLAGAFVAIAGAVVGTFVVLKGLAFLGDAVAHTSLAGAAVAFLAGGNSALISLGAGVAAVLTALGVSAVSRRSQLSLDTAIGIFFAGLFALGIVLISRTRNFALDLNSFIVGNILGVNTTDLIIMGALTAVVVLVTLYFFAELRFVAYDPEMAAASGVPVAAVQTGLLVLIALAAVVAFRLVGVVLVLAMLVAPAATVGLFVRHLRWIMVGGVALGLVATVGGLYVSFHLDVASGPSSVLVSVALFTLAFIVSPRGLRWGRRSGRARPAHVAQAPEISSDIPSR